MGIKRRIGSEDSKATCITVGTISATMKRNVCAFVFVATLATGERIILLHDTSRQGDDFDVILTVHLR